MERPKTDDQTVDLSRKERGRVLRPDDAVTISHLLSSNSRLTSLNLSSNPLTGVRLSHKKGWLGRYDLAGIESICRHILVRSDRFD